MYNDTRSATIATMPGCRDLRLRPALRLRLTGREKQPADTGRFARYRHFVLRTPKSFQVNFELFVPEAPAVNEIRRARHSPANGLLDEERQRGAIPFFWRTETGGGSRARSEMCARSDGNDRARRTKRWDITTIVVMIPASKTEIRGRYRQRGASDEVSFARPENQPLP